MSAKPKKKKTIKLRVELENKKPKEMTVRVTKDWKKNASRLDAKVKGCLAEGASYVATTGGKLIIMEAVALQKVFDNSPEEVVIIIRVIIEHATHFLLPLLTYD